MAESHKFFNRSAEADKDAADAAYIAATAAAKDAADAYTAADGDEAVAVATEAAYIAAKSAAKDAKAAAYKAAYDAAGAAADAADAAYTAATKDALDESIRRHRQSPPQSLRESIRKEINMTEEEARAARLAAVPDLLDVAKLFLSIVESEPEACINYRSHMDLAKAIRYDKAAMLARKAIAKAEGKASVGIAKAFHEGYGKAFEAAADGYGGAHYKAEAEAAAEAARTAHIKAEAFAAYSEAANIAAAKAIKAAYVAEDDAKDVEAAEYEKAAV